MVIPGATRNPRQRGSKVKLTVAAILGLALLMSGLGCQQSSDAATVRPGGWAAPAENADVGALRDLAFEYWEAFNECDVDRVLAFLEPALL